MPEIWFPYLGIKISKLNKIAFSIFNIDIYWYGIIISLGIFLGLCFVLKEAKRTNQNQNIYTDGFIIAIIFSIIFARLYYVVFSFEYFKDNLKEIFNIRNGGIAIYGAIIGGALSYFIYCKIKKLNFLKVADTISMGLLIGQIIGRFGNFVNREAFGTYTDNIFAMRYLKSQASSPDSYTLQNTITINGAEYIQVHPTFLYESFWNLIIFLIIYFYRKNKKFDGELISIYFIGYGIGRFCIEGLRTDALLIPYTNIAISRLLSIIFVISFVIFVLLKRRAVKSKV